MNKLVSCLALIIVAVVPQHGKPSKLSTQVRLSKDKPGVYISYERAGKRQPLKAGESSEGIWLRLHNNTKWTIIFPAFDIPKTYGDIGLYYSLEPVSSDKTNLSGGSSNLPIGYELRHAYSTFGLQPKGSVLFSVPREHLLRGIVLRVRFSYEWEDQDDVFADREAQHFVSFAASKLPQLK